MGTNYYIDDKHIGKRSMAGYYCMNCNKTMVNPSSRRPDWAVNLGINGLIHAHHSLYSNCECGLAIEDAPFTCSFSWAVDPPSVLGLTDNNVIIRDEYDTEYTLSGFYLEVMKCRVWFTHLVGREFC